MAPAKPLPSINEISVGQFIASFYRRQVGLRHPASTGPRPRK